MIELLKHCTLCPRKCGIDRTAGQTGYCGLPGHALIDCALAHHGEEPPLSGVHGSGTIFFSSCNLRCIFCQNYQISHNVQGNAVTSDALARIMLDLQDQKCHNINAVTPTPQAPFILSALRTARARGLVVPFVYNCGGYEDPEFIRRLEGKVDIYLPDFKYGSDEAAGLYSGAKDYVANATASLDEMARQVGHELEMDGAIAKKGLLVRHLVMPGLVGNSIAALRILRSRLSRYAPISIMSQYTPIAAVGSHPLLGRRLTRREYETVVNEALDLGFENLYIQEVDERHLSPDFEQDKPFFLGGKHKGGGMNDFSAMGRILLIVGLVVAAIGLMMMFAGKIPWIGRLPGDIFYKGKNVTFYFPVTTSIVISLLLTLLLWLINRK